MSVPLFLCSPGTEKVFSLTLWVIDVHHRHELHPAQPLPLSAHSQLEWIGYVNVLFALYWHSVIRYYFPISELLGKSKLVLGESAVLAFDNIVLFSFFGILYMTCYLHYMYMLF